MPQVGSRTDELGSGGFGWLPAPRLPEGLRNVVEMVSLHDDWLIVTHERPDGDAIGSALAVASILQGLGKRWTFLVDEPMPARFSYLPHFAEALLTKDQAGAVFRHVISVDCADKARFSYAFPFIADDVILVNVDHHQTNPHFGQASWVDSEASATCELIYHMAKALGVTLTEGLAKCLYTGILTDTGGFAQPNTTRAVHQIAALLLESGVDPYDIAQPALEARSWDQTRLLQMALNTLSVSPDGRFAALYVTRGMMEGAGCTDDDAEGLVNFARAIDTVEVGLLFRETSDGKVKVSFRSKRCVDVAKIGQVFGGGGHARAAGCTVDLSLDDAMDAVIVEVKNAIREATPCIQASSSLTNPQD